MRLLGDEFEARGWRDDDDLALTITQEMVVRGGLDLAAALQVDSATFRTRNNASKAELREAVGTAFADRTLAEEAPNGISVSAGGDVYVLQANRAVFHGPVNQGGVQINLDGASADELLTAVGALVVSGLRGDWNPDLAGALSAQLDQRDDIDLDRVQAAVVEAAEAEEPEPGRVRELIEKVAVSGIGSFLSAALSSGLGQIPGVLG
jgi:hypothetical protein